MGASKETFMKDREEDFFGTEKTKSFNPFEFLSDKFVNEIEDYENGNIDALETAILMRTDYERLEIQMNLRKTWLDENKRSIENEASKYPEGYKNYKVSMQTRSTFNFKNIEAWKSFENAKKEFEEKSKLAFNIVQKGGLNVDSNGEEIPLPEINITSFIKFDKIKKNDF
jgi:hypothetical protein